MKGLGTKKHVVDEENNQATPSFSLFQPFFLYCNHHPPLDTKEFELSNSWRERRERLRYLYTPTRI